MDFDQRDKIGETQSPAGLEAGIGLGVTALVLGLLSIGLAILIIGAGIGLIGLVVSVIHLSRRLPMRKIAITGFILSLIGTASGIGIGSIVAVRAYRDYARTLGLHDGEFSEFYGEEAPDVNFITIDGKVINLPDLKGKRVLLDFWATWCHPCRKEIPHLVKLRQETDPNVLAIIGISSESRNVIGKFASENKINYPLAAVQFYDDLPQPFNEVTSIPTLFIIDANGTIENVLSGYHAYKKLKEYSLGNSK
jgi:thiol-disulfide isomerase/thioredoxin